MANKYTYRKNIGYTMHDVERVVDNCSRNKFAEILMEGFPSFEGALYKDDNGNLFVQSVDHAFHPKECLFSIDHYRRLGAEVNIYSKES